MYCIFLFYFLFNGFLFCSDDRTMRAFDKHFQESLQDLDNNEKGFDDNKESSLEFSEIIDVYNKEDGPNIFYTFYEKGKSKKNSSKNLVYFHELDKHSQENRSLLVGDSYYIIDICASKSVLF
jgi:hypothetical protein